MHAFSKWIFDELDRMLRYLSFLFSFDKKVIQTYSVFANQDDGAGDVVVHPYNSILSMQRLIEFPSQYLLKFPF